jgi:hypothetical protein
VHERCALAGVERSGLELGRVARHARRTLDAGEERLVAEHPVRRGPADREDVRMDRVGLVGGDDPLLVEMHGLRACEEARPDPRAVCSEREHRRQAAAVADPARRDDRHRDGVDDGRHEHGRGDLAPDVAARLPALRDDDVRAGGLGTPCLLGGRDRHEDRRAAGFRAGSQRRGVAPEERDDARACGERLVEALLHRPFEHEVHRNVRIAHGSHGRRDVGRPRGRDRPEPARACDGEREGRVVGDRRLHDRHVDPQ